MCIDGMVSDIPAEKTPESNPDRRQISHSRLEPMANEAIEHEKPEPSQQEVSERDRVQIGIAYPIIGGTHTVNVRPPRAHMSEPNERNPGQRGSDGKSKARAASLSYRLRASLVIDAEPLILVLKIDVPIEGDRMRVGVIPKPVAAQTKARK